MSALDFIAEYVSHPSVSTDPAFADGMKRARGFMINQLESIGFDVELVQTALHPIILAERGHGRRDWPHVLLYSHYDVQPADPYDLWTSPPFEPEWRDGRMYGRGAADNKGPTGVQFTALKNVLARKPDLPLRITWLIEGEEEMGSPSIPKFLQDYAGRLKQADFLLMSDTGSPNEQQLVITTALRGLVGLEVRLNGPKSDLHSGIQGGAVYNPVQALTEICASLHNADGSVNVPGFYDPVVQPEQWERDELEKLGVSLEEYQTMLGVPAFHTAPGLNPFEAVRFGPTLEFNGIGGGYQGEGSKTIIPSKAFAKITCRLVAEQNPEKILTSVRDAINERCPAGVTAEVEAKEGGAPYMVVPPGRPNTPEGQPERLAKAFAAADKAVTNAFGRAPVYLREGGSVPIIAQIKDATGVDSVMIGLFTPEDNLHAPDESMAESMIDKGVRTYEEIFESVAGS